MFKFVGNLNWISSRLENLSSQFSWPESVFFCTKYFHFSLSLSLISSLFSEKVVCVCLLVIIYFLQISRYPLNTSEPRYWTFLKNTKLFGILCLQRLFPGKNNCHSSTCYESVSRFILRIQLKYSKSTHLKRTESSFQNLFLVNLNIENSLNPSNPI